MQTAAPASELCNSVPLAARNSARTARPIQLTTTPKIIRGHQNRSALAARNNANARTPAPITVARAVIASVRNEDKLREWRRLLSVSKRANVFGMPREDKTYPKKLELRRLKLTANSQ